jgi:Rrf2 family protein
MNITSKSKYALRAIIHLARTSNGVMRREDLSIAQGGISKEYLEKILLRLRELNIVEAKSGRGGGYRLAKPASELTAWDVISAVEESPQPVSCLNENAVSCGGSCEAKTLWSRVWNAAVQEMKNTSIASLAEEEIEDIDNLRQFGEDGQLAKVQCR